MKKIFLLAVCLLQSFLSYAAQKEAILKVDPQYHSGKLTSLIVTNDNRQLISASSDKSIRVWDIESGTEIRKILGHIAGGVEGRILDATLNTDNSLLAVAVFVEHGEHRHNIRLYDFKTGELIQLLAGHTNSVYSIKFSDDGKYLVSGSYDESIKIWKLSDYSLHKSIEYHTKAIYGVDIIREGSQYKVISASDDHNIAIHDLHSGQLLQSYTHTHALDFLAINKKHIAVSGFDDNAVLIFDHNLKHIKTLKNNRTTVLAFSPDGRYLASINGYKVDVYDTHSNFAYTAYSVGGSEVTFYDNNTFIVSNASSLKYFSMSKNKVIKTLKGIGRTTGKTHLEGETLTFKRSKLVQRLNLSAGGITPVKNAQFTDLPKKYAGYTLSTAKGGNYNYHNGKLVITKDNQTVASITLDAPAGYRHKEYGFYGAYIVSGKLSGSLSIYNLEGKLVKSLVGHSGDILSLSTDGNRLVTTSLDQTIRIWNLDDLSADEKKIEPMLNIFISADDEWVIWTQSGYYNTSVGGDKYVGYHINQGITKEARFVSSESYFDTLFRPDITALVFKTGSEKKAIAFANQTRRVKKVDVASSLPPKVHLLSQSVIKTKQNSITIEFKVESETPVEQTIVMLNGRKIDTRGLTRKKSNKTQTVKVDLEDGQNNIEIRAQNNYALSNSALVDVYKESVVKTLFKPTLYVLSIGVSDYKNQSYNLDSADKDALAISNMFQAQKGKIYKDVVIKTLVNEDALSGNILDGLDWIDQEATSKDVVVVFIAGHGVNDEKGNYYFLSHDGDTERLRRTGVKWLEIEDTISNLPSKVILLADTCHSGNIMGQRRNITSAIKSITNSGSGSIIMTAATGSGYSYEEKAWGHGAFTKSLLEGIDELKADFDKDGIITVKEIDLYVTTRVKKLTKGKQKPTTIIPSSVPDFAIGLR